MSIKQLLLFFLSVLLDELDKLYEEDKLDELDTFLHQKFVN